MAPPPHDLTLEQALLGACLIDPDLAPRVARILQPHDLYSPAHAHLLATIYDEHEAGHRVDPTTVAARAGGIVTDAARVVAACIAACTSTSAAPTIAARIADLSALRRVQALTLDTLGTIDNGSDPARLIDHLAAGLAAIDLATDDRPITGLWTAEAMMAADFPVPPAVVPGFLSREDRLMVVGLEGSGKSVWCRQVCAQVASGVHPFDTDHTFEPQPTLMVDLENPERVIRAGLRMMRAQPANMHILARPGGLDLRSRRDRSLLHRACERVQPRLLYIGPVYKMARPERGESDEDAAVALQAILDDVRVRFGCALLLEHHAPKGSDVFRKLVPFGSSAWLRWPEFGWQLIPYDEAAQLPSEKGASLLLGTFRGDRVQIDKPQYLHRGMNWPWLPYWPEGSPFRRGGVERF